MASTSRDTASIREKRISIPATSSLTSSRNSISTSTTPSKKLDSPVRSGSQGNTEARLPPGRQSRSEYVFQTGPPPYVSAQMPHSKPSSNLTGVQRSHTKAKDSSLALVSSIRPRSSLPPTSIIATSMLPSVIRSQRIEDELPFGEGSLASKLCLLEATQSRLTTQRPSRVQKSQPLRFPGSFPSSVPPTLAEPKQKPSQVIFSAPLLIPGSFPVSISPYKRRSTENAQKPSPSVKTEANVHIPGSFPVSMLPPVPAAKSFVYTKSRTKCTQKPTQIKPSEPSQIPGSFPASMLPRVEINTDKTHIPVSKGFTHTRRQIKPPQKPTQVKAFEKSHLPGSFAASTVPNIEKTTTTPSRIESSKPLRKSSGAHPRSSHRPQSSIRGRPSNLLELNAALFEYLSKSSRQIIWGFLKAWATSWGFFKFDRDNAFEVIDLLVNDIEHAIAEQTKELISRAGIEVEKGEVLKMVRMLKEIIVRKFRRHLGFP